MEAVSDGGGIEQASEYVADLLCKLAHRDGHFVDRWTRRLGEEERVRSRVSTDLRDRATWVNEMSIVFQLHNSIRSRLPDPRYHSIDHLV